jgi:hypothetical protein
MPKYRVIAEVTQVTGTQTYEVEAENVEEAREKVSEGLGHCIDECLEVQDFEVESITEKTQD